MSVPFKLAMIGLDSSHSVEFARLMQGDAPEAMRVNGMRAVSAVRFPSAFQAEEGQNARQAQLEAWGVSVGTDFDAAVKGVDGILLEVNDPTLHVEWFERAVKTGLPIFIDKPLADTVEHGQRMLELAQAAGCRCWSSSSIRFMPELMAASEAVPTPDRAGIYGTLGIAPAGSSLIWYGVHTNEAANAVMGCGAKSVFARQDESGITQIIEYGGTRHAVVESLVGFYRYGGHVQNAEMTRAFECLDAGTLYALLMQRVQAFFCEGVIPVPLETSLEILAVLEASERSLASGQDEVIRF